MVVVTQAIRTYLEVLSTLYGLTSCAFKVNYSTILQSTLTASTCLLLSNFLTKTSRKVNVVEPAYFVNSMYNVGLLMFSLLKCLRSAVILYWMIKKSLCT